jgi:hypothetical protein
VDSGELDYTTKYWWNQYLLLPVIVNIFKIGVVMISGRNSSSGSSNCSSSSSSSRSNSDGVISGGKKFLLGLYLSEISSRFHTLAILTYKTIFCTELVCGVWSLFYAYRNLNTLLQFSLSTASN